MKHTNKIFGTLLLATAVLNTSCVDDDKLEFAFEKPASIEGMEYLADYKALKEYVHETRGANPNFKLGVALAAADYTADGLVTRLANSNFDEMTAGNAMKMASCVADDGTMSFGNVENFVSAAKSNGMTIYGHTLAWHSQQPNKWLNSIIADKEMEVDPDAKVEKVDYELDCSTLSNYSWSGNPGTVITEWNKDGAVVITNPEATPNFWDLQYWLVNGISLESGKGYKLTITCKAEGESDALVRFKLGDWGNGANQQFSIPVGGDYEEITLDVTPVIESNGLFFQHGDFVGKIYWKSMKITHSEAPVFEIYTDQVTNGAMEKGKPMDNFVVREPGQSDVPGTPIAGGPEGKNYIKITSHANPANSWDTQFFIYTPNKTWAGGEQYKISFWYKASEAANSETQCHGNPGSYMHYSMLSPNPSFTTEWQYYESTSSIPAAGDGMKSIAFNLNVNANAVDYYFADIHWYTIEKGNKLPLTPEEKKDTLTWAMGNWINGMMGACGGYVNTWDVVNEALSGADKDGDGKYDLQSATRGTVSAEDAKNNFYWQDYLGDLDYVRTAVRLAREKYAENGGEGELKLFINDYNLESDWDDNGKVKSLVQWIKDWEADGVTKIDGIGSQMHVSCYADANTQKSKEEHVVKMLEILAKSGKLIKISELDMGYVDASGNSVKTQDLTQEQHKQMAAYYKFIISKYFEIIPETQQYGITQWCITDAPADSGWRAGEPVGLWDSNYNRKHTYAGFADGLSGK